MEDEIEITLDVEIETELHKGEAPSRDCPGEPSSVELVDVLLKGESILHLLTNSQIQEIKDNKMADYLADAEDRKYEYELQKAEDRLYR